MEKLYRMLLTLDAVDAAIVELEKIRRDLTRSVHKFVVEKTDIPVLYVDKKGVILGELDRKTNQVMGKN